MIIRADPSQEQDSGKQLPVPATMKKHISKWAVVQYRQYAFGTILMQQYITRMFSIYIFQLDIEEAVILYPFSKVPTLVLQLMLKGNLSCLLKGYGKFTLQESKYNLFYFPVGANEALFQKGEYEFLHIELHTSYLEELTLSHSGIPVLLNRLRESSPSAQALQMAAINKEIKYIIREMRAHAQEGSSLNLVLNSDIYKLLSIYAGYISRPANPAAYLMPAMEKKLSEIRHYIIDDPDIHECSVENLAKRFHLNSNTLRINFKNRFNVTLHRFVLDQCMQRARLLVLRGSDSITSIAYTLGYTDKSNFAKAFKQYFGVLPNEMRKRQE